MAAMLERSQQAGVKSMIITGGSLSESRRALKLAKELGNLYHHTSPLLFLSDSVCTDLYATIGCHPTRSAEFNKTAGGPEKYLADLDKLIGENLEGKGRVVAVGECGLGESAWAVLVFRFFF
jgi:TatD DNase family protein